MGASSVSASVGQSVVRSVGWSFVFVGCLVCMLFV